LAFNSTRFAAGLNFFCALPSRDFLAQDPKMSFRDKLLTFDKLPAWREKVRRSEKKLVATNGCFDLLHLGHITYLETARQFGDLLIVGINGDKSVRELKGHDRPVNLEIDRASVIAALESVDAAIIFPEMRAVNFLESVQPDIWIKGGDYTLETINQEERSAVEKHGGQIIFVPFVTEKSTTSLLEKISRL